MRKYIYFIIYWNGSFFVNQCEWFKNNGKISKNSKNEEFRDFMPSRNTLGQYMYFRIEKKYGEILFLLTMAGGIQVVLLFY